ncbi:hypothetical protein FN846DRAFT_529170 [Sphaerosporella brunnea]|uniref:Uncharacterized protein n=1 Tax=Sphaerosporella brunnea TaxID=1250544 RepID=A0A5J5ED02_9PEZI|nr:hypothetical protein FN846DRAFT_529170 [Sphaerosporella brunnea]
MDDHNQSRRRNAEQNKHQAPNADALDNLVPLRAGFWKSLIWIVESLDRRKQAWPAANTLEVIMSVQRAQTRVLFRHGFQKRPTKLGSAMPELAVSHLHQQWAERANEPYVYDKLVPLAALVSTVANLSAQPDFKGQRSRIEEVVEDAGHLVMFYPKFHCELN